MRQTSPWSSIRVGRTWDDGNELDNYVGRADAREEERCLDPEFAGRNGERGGRGSRWRGGGLLFHAEGSVQSGMASASSAAWRQCAMAHSGEGIFWNPPGNFK